MTGRRRGKGRRPRSRATGDLQRQPDNWLEGARVADATIVTAAVLATASPDTWASTELASLRSAFGYVLARDLTRPKRGVEFTFLDQDSATSVYGFPAPDRIEVFTFTATTAYLGPDPDPIVATFSDGRLPRA